VNAALAGFWKFLFPRDSGRWVELLRIGLGLQLIIYTWSLRRDWRELFGTTGPVLVNRALVEAVLSGASFFTPRIGWLVSLGKSFGIGEGATLLLLWLCLFSLGVLFLIGWSKRLTAIAAWFLYLCTAKSGTLFSYGVDNFTIIGLFYAMIAPFPGPRTSPERLGFHRRVLQLHLCIIYFFGGLSKCLGAEWWNGTSIWRALTRPPFDLIPPDLLIRFEFLFPFLGIAVCLLETSYPIFIWLGKTRAIWLSGILLIHLSIGLTMGLHLFALIMIVLNLAAFGPEFFPDRLVVSGRRWLARRHSISRQETR